MKADGEDNNLDKDVENDIKDNMNAKDNIDLGVVVFDTLVF